MHATRSESQGPLPVAACIAGTLALLGCSSTNATAGSPEGGAFEASGPAAPAPCTTVVPEAECDKNQRPFVFVHGTYGFEANFAHVAQLLGSNGFCQDRIVGIHYNSVGIAVGAASLGDSPGAVCTAPNTPPGCGMIDDLINRVLADPHNVDASGHPFTQVDLAGHSQGTFHASTYLSVPSQAAKVAHYINFSGTVPTYGVPTLSLSSQHDLGMTPHHACPGSTCTDAGVADASSVTEVTFMDQDHFAVAASQASFVQVYRYLTGHDPQYNTVQCGSDPVTVEGSALHFADNAPASGRIEIRPTASTPRDESATPIVVNPDATGHWGPVSLTRNRAYEFRGFDTNGTLLGYSYFTPFKRSSHLVTMLSPASGTDGTSVGATVASLTTNKIVRSSNHSAIVALWLGGAFRQDLGASLKIDGAEALTSGNAGADAFAFQPDGGGIGILGANQPLNGGVVSLIMYDANNDMRSELGLVDTAPFIAFTDVFVDSRTPSFVDLLFTPGSEETATTNVPLVIANWPSSNALVNVWFQ